MPDQISFTCGSFTGVIGAVVKYQGCILDEVVPAMEALRGKCDLRIIDFESSLRRYFEARNYSETLG